MIVEIVALIAYTVYCRHGTKFRPAKIFEKQIWPVTQTSWTLLAYAV